MEGLSKKAFDFSQLAHMYDMIQHIPHEPSFVKHMLSPQGLMQTGGSVGGTTAAKSWFGRRGSNLLNTGIEMGKNNEQMNPFTSTIAHNFIGKSKMAPYHEGMQIGNAIREQGLTGDDEAKYIQSVVDQKAAEKEQLEAAGKKVSNPTLNAFDNYQTGSFEHNKVFNKMVGAKSIPQGKKALAQKAIAHTISAPIAHVVDPFAIARPIVSKAESMPKVNEQLTKVFPDGTKRQKMYSGVRNFID